MINLKISEKFVLTPLLQRRGWGWLFFFFFFKFSVFGQISETEKATFLRLQERLAPLHQPVKRQEGDWLSQVNSDPKQPFEVFCTENPLKIDVSKVVIYIQPIGKFNKHQKKILKELDKYLSVFFGMKVVSFKEISDDFIPAKDRRKMLSEQLRTTYLLYEYLLPKIPKDAAAFIAFTEKDLYPQDSWAYVFGQASLSQKIGVWSMYRFGNPKTSQKIYDNCQLLAFKTATHEIGHIFGIQHCQLFHCNMNGSMSLADLALRPTYFCPDCQSKLSWRLSLQMRPQFEKLERYWHKIDNPTESEFYKFQKEKIY